MELIVEQVSRSKKVLSRHQMIGPHISIGRGFDNDIILNDPYVDPNHLLLTVNQEGRWLAKDEDTTNGSYFENESKLNHPRPVHSGEVVAIGKSFVRFIYPDHPVAPTMRLSGLESLLNWLGSPLILAGVFCFYLSLLLLSFYMGAVTEIKTSQMFTNVFAKVLMVSLLPMMFAFLARLFKHEARIVTQLVVWYGFFTLFLLVDSIGELISFNSSQIWLSSSIVFVAEVMLIFALLWLAFYIAFHQRPLRRLIMVSSLTLGMLSLSYLYSSSNSSDFSVKPSYDNTLLAPEFAIKEPVSVSEFIDRSEAIFEFTTEQAEK